MLAFPLHMAVMADGGFPFGAVGLVHVENRIEQHRRIGIGEELTIRVRPTKLQPHPKGQTFSLLTEVTVGGEVVWESTSTMLRRGKGDDAAPKQRARLRRSRSPRRCAPASAEWKLGGDLGRRYAAVSGDRNPIHMHSLTAKPLGFPGAIAHGMWTKARCLAALDSRLPDAFAVDVRFRKPILLPARVEFASATRGRGDRLRRARREAADPSPRRPRDAARETQLQSQNREEVQVTTTTDSEKSASVAERSMGFGLRQLNRLAGSDLLDRIRIRKQVERALFQGTKNGFRSATAAGRTFKAAQQLGKPARQKKGKSKGLFDLAPDDEQQMFQEARPRLRRGRRSAPPRSRPTTNCETPKELLDQATELGVNMLGVPEELGGVMHEQSAVTSVLIGEALAHGDMGIAYAALAPGAVATAIGLWGSAEQEATYLPAFTGEDVPAAALAILEPRPLFDPLKLETKRARRKARSGSSKGAKSLLARAKDCELFVIAAEAEGIGPALFVVESGAKGLSVEDEPAMGLRPAATGRLLIDNVKLPASALLGEGERKAKDYADCVNRSRIAWCGLATGTAQAVLDYVIPYVNDRQAFGEPISNRQGVAFAVSDIGIESDGMRLATYRAASRADRGEKFAREAAIARRLCAVKGMQIGSEGVQLLGGHGFVKEHPVERWYRDLRAAGVMEGALLV